MAKEKSPSFQFYPDSWLSSADIILMTCAEEGAYIRLLCHEWLQPDCGLPNDDNALALLSRLGDQWHSGSGQKLRKKFTAVGDRIFNDRLVEEKQKQIEWRQKSAAGGQKSAQKRWPGKGGYHLVKECLEPNCNSSSSSSSSINTKNHSSTGVDDFSETQVPVIPENPAFDVPDEDRTTLWDEPSLEHGDPVKNGTAPRKLTLPELQDQWFQQEVWPEYWRKVDKAVSLRAWKRHATSETKKNSIIEALRKHRPSMLARENQHRPHLASWLNKQRYLEEPEEPEAGKTAAQRRLENA